MTTSGIGFEALREEYNEHLLTAFQNNNFDKLKYQFYENKNSDYDKKAAMEQVFRDVLLTLLKEKDIKNLGNFISFSINCCRLEMTGPTMAVVLLGDIFDALTLKDCELMFCYVEENVSVWKEDIFFIACKNNLLRMCNDLLRRLSRSQNTVFCGRILLFLAKFFPFSERSGLNIVSEFNLENVTELSNEDTDLNFNDTVEGDKDEKKVPIDYNLYCKFWSLQEFFRNPNLCYNKGHWKLFASHTTNVLSAFNSFKLDAVQTKSINKISPKADNTAKANESSTSSEQTHYYAKYLTNQKLLELQLSDSNFRRYVFLQFLILFQYLKSTVKFKMESFVLTAPQMDWVNVTWNQVISLLCETPPDGKQFAVAVEQIMSREEAWSGWKNEGCPEFKKPASVALDSEDADKKSKSSEKSHSSRAKRPRKMLGDILKESQAQGKFYMGHDDLTKLWNLCPDNLLSCKGKERDFLPGLEYLDNRGNDPNNEWRALRLAARKCPQFYTNSTNPPCKLTDFLDQMAKRPGKEGKDAKQQSPETNQGDETENFNEPIDSDFLKSENDSQLMEQSQATSKPKIATPGQIDILSIKIASEWKKLGAKLGYRSDEMEFFETEHKTPAAAAKKMLQLWFEDDVDASLDNLAYTLEGLDMIAGAEIIKTFE